MHARIGHMELDEASTRVRADPRRQLNWPSEPPEGQRDVRGGSTRDFHGEFRLIVRDHDIDEGFADCEHVGDGLCHLVSSLAVRKRPETSLAGVDRLRPRALRQARLCPVEDL